MPKLLARSSEVLGSCNGEVVQFREDGLEAELVEIEHGMMLTWCQKLQTFRGWLELDGAWEVVKLTAIAPQ